MPCFLFLSYDSSYFPSSSISLIISPTLVLAFPVLFPLAVLLYRLLCLPFLSVLIFSRPFSQSLFPLLTLFLFFFFTLDVLIPFLPLSLVSPFSSFFSLSIFVCSERLLCSLSLYFVSLFSSPTFSSFYVLLYYFSLSFFLLFSCYSLFSLYLLLELLLLFAFSVLSPSVSPYSICFFLSFIFPDRPFCFHLQLDLPLSFFSPFLFS